MSLHWMRWRLVAVNRSEIVGRERFHEPRVKTLLQPQKCLILKVHVQVIGCYWSWEGSVKFVHSHWYVYCGANNFELLSARHCDDFFKDVTSRKRECLKSTQGSQFFWKVVDFKVVADRPAWYFFSFPYTCRKCDKCKCDHRSSSEVVLSWKTTRKSNKCI